MILTVNSSMHTPRERARERHGLADDLPEERVLVGVVVVQVRLVRPAAAAISSIVVPS